MGGMHRYFEEDPGAGMTIDDEDGDWVKYGDVEALVKQLKDKDATIAKLKGSVFDLVDDEDDLPDGCVCAICRAVKLAKEGN